MSAVPSVLFVAQSDLGGESTVHSLCTSRILWPVEGTNSQTSDCDNLKENVTLFKLIYLCECAGKKALLYNSRH